MKQPVFNISTENYLAAEDSKITQWFFKDMNTRWDFSDLDYNNPNDVPNLNLTITGLLLSAVIDCTVGKHAWDLTELTLEKLGFTDLRHHYFELTEMINKPAVVFGRSREKVNGKYVVAAVYRGTSSVADVISDIKAEPHGFENAGINSVKKLRAYLAEEGLTKEDTILFITGHSYGAASASLVALRSTDLAERDSIFCYVFATPNYARKGMTGEGTKMFCFCSNEDIVPQVPVGPGLDKTGAVIVLDRINLKQNEPEKYERFLRFYRYFRGRDFEEDHDFQPIEYTFQAPVRIPNNNPISRNHLPYTYMALIMAEVPEEIAETFIPD